MAIEASQTAAVSRTRGLCELTPRSADHLALAEFYRRVLDLPVLSRQDDRIWLGCGPNARIGPWSPGVKEFGEDPEGNVVELWDYFEDGNGANAGIDAL